MLFAVECVYYHAMNTPEAVKMVLDTIASPNLRVLCDFANYVGPEDASLDAQRRIWDRVGSWYGDKIAAVHFKGQNFRPMAPCTPPAWRIPAWTMQAASPC